MKFLWQQDLVGNMYEFRMDHDLTSDVLVVLINTLCTDCVAHGGVIHYIVLCKFIGQIVKLFYICSIICVTVTRDNIEVFYAWNL